MPFTFRPQRIYYPTRRGQVVQGGGDFERGWKIGGEIAKGLGGLGEAIAKQQQIAKQNAVANQLLQQHGWAPPPRAGLVAPGVNPQTGAANVIAPTVSTAGTAPASGGVEELNMRIAEAKARMGLQQEQFRMGQEVAKQGLLQQAAARGGSGSGASPWGTQGRPSASTFIQNQTGQDTKKPQKYVAGSATPTDPSYYNYNNQRTDVDSRYGKGTFDKLQSVPSLITQDPKTGQWASKDPAVATVDPKSGAVTLTGAGGKPGATISGPDLVANMKRYDATTVMQGGQPVYNSTFNYLKGQAPETGKPTGSAENPFMPVDTVDLNAIPPGQYFVNPTDQKVHQKQAPATAAKPAAATNTDTSADTSKDTSTDTSNQEDTSNQGNTSQAGFDANRDMQLASANLPSPQFSPNSAVAGSNVAPNPLPNPADAGQGDQAGLPQDPELIAAIRQAQALDQLNVQPATATA